MHFAHTHEDARVRHIRTSFVSSLVSGVVLAGYDRQFANEHYMSPEDNIDNIDPDKVRFRKMQQNLCCVDKHVNATIDWLLACSLYWNGRRCVPFTTAHLAS